MRKANDGNQPCPNPAGSHYRLINRGHVSAIASYLTKSGRRRIFKCSLCCQSFSETRDTVFFDLRTEEEKVIMALKMWLVRCELTAISSVLGVTEETTLGWHEARRPQKPKRSISTCGVRCRSRTSNLMRCGTSAVASLVWKRWMKWKVLLKPQTDDTGSGSVLRQNTG